MPPAAPDPLSATPPRAGSSREDVVNAYRLVLGRNTESESVIATNRTRPPARTVEVLLRSAEFSTAVMDRLGADRLPPHGALPAEQAREAADWAAALGLIEPLPGAAPGAATAIGLVLALAEAPAVRGIHGAKLADALRARRAARDGEALIERLARPVEPEEARLLSRLLLGPDHAEGEAGADPSLLHLLQRAIAAPAFRERVLAPLAAGAAPAHLPRAEAAAALAARRLGLPDPEGEAGRALAALLALPAVEDMVARAWPAELSALRAALPALAAGGLAAPAPARAHGPLPASADVLAWSEDGVFLEGWADDRVNPVAAVLLRDPATGETTELPAWRARRPDVEQHLRLPNPAELALWTAAALPYPANAEGLEFQLRHRHGGTTPFAPAQRLALDRRAFFEHVLAFFGRRAVIGNAAARGMAELDGALGPLIGTLHRRLAATRRVTARGDFRGAGAGAPRLSLVTVLYGVPDFLYLLVAQFARFARLDALEFLFVCNSPEIEEAMLRDAELAAFTFGTTVRVIGLDQNCGFSHANNIAIAAAGAEAVLVINPDVFPRHAGAVAHLMQRAAAGLGRRLVGGLLHYADGTVMHDGMFFTLDAVQSAQAGQPVWTVEHFRKGFPDRPGAPPPPRAVPAVSGALMLLDRRFALELGPFDEGYVFGHYEDADLCLRVREAGGEVLLDPALAFWHYEGRGSITRPEHRGSAIHNRWRFSRRWAAQLGAEGG